jgi:hypothetical protein
LILRGRLIMAMFSSKARPFWITSTNGLDLKKGSDAQDRYPSGSIVESLRAWHGSCRQSYGPLTDAHSIGPRQSCGQRCPSQIHWALDAFEAECGNEPTRFWLGESLGHTDLAVAGALRFSKEAHPMLFSQERWAALAAHNALCESLEWFRETSPTFSPPS